MSPIRTSLRASPSQLGHQWERDNVDCQDPGNGILQLSGANTFGGGVSVGGVSGGLVLTGSTNITTLVSAGLGANLTALATGPVGTGAVSMASGTTLYVAGANSTIVNSVASFAGNPLFDDTSDTAGTLTLAGGITTTGAALNVTVTNPNMSVLWSGPISNIGTITSVTKSGLGNFGLNLSGIGSSVPLTFNNGGSLTLLDDGDGSGSPNSVGLGSVTLDTMAIPVVTIGRAGQTLSYNQALNKTIAPASFTSAGLANGLNLTNNNAAIACCWSTILRWSRPRAIAPVRSSQSHWPMRLRSHPGAHPQWPDHRWKHRAEFNRPDESRPGDPGARQ